MNLPNKEPKGIRELLENIAAILEKMEKEIAEVIEKYGVSVDPRCEQQDPVEIQHVGYDADQLGRNK